MAETAPEVIRPTKLAHVVLRTGRFEEVVAWYTTVLGAHVVHQAPFAAFLTYDEEHHRLAVINLGDDVADAPAGRPGLEHVAFTYNDLDELVTTYERLAAVGIEPAWCVNHGMTLSMYFADPDGNQVELQVDLCSPAEAAEFMAGSTFEANPIGVPYDPAELARQHRAGDRPAILDQYGPRAEAARP